MAHFYDLYDEENQKTISHKDFEHAKDHLIGLLEDIYDTGTTNNLEFHLEEICSVFGIKLPKNEPMFSIPKQKKAKKNDPIFQEAVGFARAYASMIYNN